MIIDIQTMNYDEYQNRNGKFYKASDTRFDPMGHSNRHTMSEYDGVHRFILF